MQDRIVSVHNMITVDSSYLNYNTFFPGKLLGSTLSVGNKSNSEQIVELSVDSNTLNYCKKELCDSNEDAELPFELNGPGTMVNSEYKHEAWFIENPKTRELTKRITLKLGPKAE